MTSVNKIRISTKYLFMSYRTFLVILIRFQYETLLAYPKGRNLHLFSLNRTRWLEYAVKDPRHRTVIKPTIWRNPQQLKLLQKLMSFSFILLLGSIITFTVFLTYYYITLNIHLNTVPATCFVVSSYVVEGSCAKTKCFIPKFEVREFIKITKIK